MSTDPTRDPRWYAVQCKPRQDARAEENLRNQHFPCYRPVQQVSKLRNGRREQISESLFPGYLFVHLCPHSDDWHSIRSTRGVSRLVTFATRAAEVPQSIIDCLRSRLDGQAPEPLFAPGQKVRVLSGAMRELEAVFERECGEERAMILLGLLHRQHRLEVPLSQLQAVG